jgi:hypothetical protein
MFTGCGSDGSSFYPPPPADLDMSVVRTAGQAPAKALWTGDVNLKAAADTSADYGAANAAFTVSYKGVEETILLNTDYTDADGVLTEINAQLTAASIGLVATYDASGGFLVLEAATEENGFIAITAADDAFASSPDLPSIVTGSATELYETYTLTFTGDYTLQDYDVTLAFDTTEETESGVPAGTTAVELAEQVVDAINASGGALNTLLSSEYVTAQDTTYENVVTITAIVSTTNNNYTITIDFEPSP